MNLAKPRVGQKGEDAFPESKEIAMSPLADYRKRVEQIENSRTSAGVCERACAALIHDLCGTNWQTPTERQTAQALVARLERLQYGTAPAQRLRAKTAG